MKRSVLKKTLMVGILLTSLIFLAGCSAQTSDATPAVTESAASAVTAEETSDATAADTNAADPTATPELVTLKVFDAEELAKYDGQNGNPAYIAVDGKVYDVSDVAQWKDGSHFGRYQAGQDLTEEIKTESPHGVSKLDSIPIVGLYEP
jgi:predicted heme/steroid binding protein